MVLAKIYASLINKEKGYSSTKKAIMDEMEIRECDIMMVKNKE